ncbi:universal stress protein [Paractinoplanes ferrugineus]|uniref:Universal stress protein n=2 Tax=Paractinoplanes ferrugineus TaxID=113564 RepID=A0A919J5T2_9ACTN|nr:universal stress protein [Actinoplanes ferrugineus]
MRNPVVVGVSGTSAGLAAARLAAREAVSRDCQLRVIHAFTWPNPGASEDYEDARRAASRVVEEAVASAKRSTPRVRVAGQLVDGPPDRVLVRLSRTSALLVLAGDDLATAPSLPLSSVLPLTVGHSWCPVMVTHGPRTPAGALMVAVDGSASGLLALRYAAAESRRRRVGVEVVHVVREFAGRHEEEGHRVLAASIAAVPELGRVRTLVLAGAPGPTLVHAGAHARVLVIGPRGTRGTGLLGSVAREVMHRAACPAIFVHGRAIPAQRTPSGSSGALAR